MTALIKAINNGRWRQAHLLVEAGCNVNCRGIDRRTPLIELCFLHNQDKAVVLAKKLINKGAKVGLEDSKGISALSYACLLGKRKLVFLFIEFVDYDLNSTDRHQNTALFHAVTNGDKTIVREIVKKLKCYNLSVDIKNCRGESPLMQAIKQGHFGCADILIREGKSSLCVYNMEYERKAQELHKEVKENQDVFEHPFTTTLEKRIREKQDEKNNQSCYECYHFFRKRKRSASHNEYTPSKQTPSVSEFLPHLYRIYNQQNSLSFRRGYRHILKQTTFSENKTVPESGKNESQTVNNSSGKNSTISHKLAFSKLNEPSTRIKDLKELGSTALKSQKLTNSVLSQTYSLPDVLEKFKAKPATLSTTKGGSRPIPKVPSGKNIELKETQL